MATSILNDKKAKAAWRNNHDLHVMLIVKQEGVSKGDAAVLAYHEGVQGLSERMFGAPSPASGE